MIKRGKTPVTNQRQLLEKIRNHIVCGDLGPGARLPTRTEIRDRFGVSNDMVRAVFDRLLREGFVDSQGSRGTFVADYPPHLYHYALVFQGHPQESTEQPWSQHWKALADSAALLQRHSPVPRKIITYHDVNGHDDSESQRQLIRDASENRLAGVMFVNSVFVLEDSPLLEMDIPRVSFNTATVRLPQVHGVYVDFMSFIDKALDEIVAQGRRRVAALVVGNWDISCEEHWDQAIAKRGLVCPSYWRQAVAYPYSRWANEAVQLLMRGKPEEQPDAMVIFDDHLVNDASRGLVASGMQVPEQVHVVAHCNFPLQNENLLPIRRLGPDTRQMMASAIECIDRLRAHEPLPSHNIGHVPLFDHEISKQMPMPVTKPLSVSRSAPV